MSANFTFSLSNPDVGAPPPNVVYTGAPAGNRLNLVIGNNLGFDVTVGGSSEGKYLLLNIPDSVIDSAGAGKLNAVAPWKIGSVTPPAKKGDPYVFSLQPPDGGARIPNKGSLTIQLKALEPSAKGNTQLTIRYDFGNSVELNLSAGLSIIGDPDPELANLFGETAPLRFDFMVNGGGQSTPLIVSAAPVTPANGVENLLQMIVDFQENASLMKKTGGPWLADKWNANKPPQFRFFFLYSSPFSSSPAVYDLTDCSQPGDEDYNPVTTAWNIRESLDAKNPNVQSNDFWHITLDGTSKLPVWQVMPTPANVHIFTTAGSGPGNPGPLLNLFWSHIFSGLPIDQNNPETMLFMQWLDFPGFNDGIQGFPLLKQYAKPVLKPVIDCFSGTIEHDASGVKVVLKWATHNAANCTVSGDSSLQSPQTGDNPYKRIISLEEPLNTSYTLTAFSADGNRSTTQTLQVKWKPNPELGPTKWPNGIKLALFSGGAHLVVLQSDLNMEPQSPSTLSFVHPLNLEASLPPFSFPKTVQIYNITVSPIDQDTVFACGTDFPLQMFAFSYNKSTGQAVKSDALPFPPWNTALHVSSDGATLMALLIGAGGHGIGVLNSATLKSMSGSPILTAQEPMVSFGVGPQTGRIFVNYEDKMHVFDPKTYQDVPGSPFRSYSDILLFPSDEQAVFSRVLDLAKLNPTTFAIENKAEFYLNEPISYMITPDNSLLFVSGMNDTKQVINVYDAATMLLQNWSPWEAPDKQIQDMKISPDGTRIFILTGDGDLYAADPYF